MNRKLSEKRALVKELDTYLKANGWTDIIIKDRRISDMSVPVIGITYSRSSGDELQLGRSGNRIFRRVIQFDVYMEDEARVDAICDDIMDFIDLTPVYIIDINNNTIGSLICYDSGTISSESMPPILNDPTVIRWRGIVRAEFEAHYPNG